jgi:hypothetical protein
MKLHLIPVVLAMAIPVATYLEVVQKNAPGVADLQARVLKAAMQYDTVNASTVIKPRLASERAAIAQRLRGVRPFGVSEAQSTFLAELVRAARINHVGLINVSTKGKAVPFVAATAPQTAPQAPGTQANAAGPPKGQQPALALSSLADGVTIPQEIMATGSLQNLLTFVDAFGQFAVPVQVGNVSFSTSEALTLTVDCDVVVLSAVELADAKRPTLATVPAALPEPVASPPSVSPGTPGGS